MSLCSESAGLESISKVFYWICIQIHLLTNLWDRCVHLLSRHGSIFRKCWFTGILHIHLWDSQRKYQLCGSCASSWCSTKVRKEQLCVAHTHATPWRATAAEDSVSVRSATHRKLAAVCTDSSKLDNRRLEKPRLVWWVLSFLVWKVWVIKMWYK